MTHNPWGISYTDTMFPNEIIRRFDEFLESKQLRLEAVVVGGAALALLGVISRQTRDCDILHPSLQAEILSASKSFAVELRKKGEMLDDDWLNNGPSTLTKVLPDGWQDRLQLVFEGRAVILRSLGREELIMSKLFAMCDRGIDLNDCLALSPSSTELNKILPWLKNQDTNPGWPEHVQSTIDDLKEKLGHGV